MNNLSLSQSSLQSDDKNFVSETPEAEIFKPGDLSKSKRVLSRLDLVP